MGWLRRFAGRHVLVALMAAGILVLAPAGPAAAGVAGGGPFCCNSSSAGYSLSLSLQPQPAAAGQQVTATAMVSPPAGGGTASFLLGSACQNFCQNQPPPTTSLGSCTLQTMSIAGTSAGECDITFPATATGAQGVYVVASVPVSGGGVALTMEANLTVTPGSGSGSGGGTPPGGGSAAGPASGTAPASPFTDLGGVPWAAPQIALLHDQGVVAGTTATRFSPRGSLTGQAAATLLARLFLPAGAAGPASPLPGVAGWAQAAVAWAETHGVIRSAGTFAPGRPAPRAEVAAWVVRALGLSCQCAPASDLHFADAGAIPSAYRQADTVAEVDGLFVGDAQGNFHPAEPITRAQMAVVLVRAERALAAHGTSAAPFTWTASGGPGGGASTWTGTARMGTASLPTGAIDGGTLSLTGPGGRLAESFLRWQDAGTATVHGSMGGQTGAVRLYWRRGTIWDNGGTETYGGSTAGGSLSLQAASSCGAGCSQTTSATYQTAISGGAETARSCPGGGSQCLTYRGPVLPGPVLLATGQFVFGLALGGAGGS